ncbi:MAG: DUF2804 domain-containing protein [Clostridia bacterium]|nr:DUF2804 domain-containing protein [Clostridia bacterium]
MSKQIEITKPTLLLKEDGSLTQPGYCKRNLFIYNRESIKAPKLRIKEWDFYQVSDGRFVVQMNFFNISIASVGQVEVFDMQTGKRWNDMMFHLLTVNSHQVNRNGDAPYSFEDRQGSKLYKVDVTETERRLYFKNKSLEVELIAERDPNAESITIATPFKNKTRFFLTNKINCMPTEGTIKEDGKEVYAFDKSNSYMVLDWGRGPWPYKNMWYWANGSTRLPDGKLFGFELTWGIGIEDNATETCLFYDGKAHKIGVVDVVDQPDGRWLEPWHFKSDDGRLDLVMTPFFDNFNPLNVGVAKTVCHQVHGYWNGTVTLDDGTVLEIKDMYAFCEKMYNKW